MAEYSHGNLVPLGDVKTSLNHFTLMRIFSSCFLYLDIKYNNMAYIPTEITHANYPRKLPTGNTHGNYPPGPTGFSKLILNLRSLSIVVLGYYLDGALK